MVIAASKYRFLVGAIKNNKSWTATIKRNQKNDNKVLIKES